MLGFTLIEAAPLPKPRKLDGPTFATAVPTVVPQVQKKKLPVLRRTVGIRSGEKLSRHSPAGSSPSQDLHDGIENQDGYWSGDDDEDDQSHIARLLKRAQSPDAFDAKNKRAKVTGGRTVAFRQVTVDLDTDDEIIKTMKDQGIRDEVVQQRLISEGRTKYEIKTISTRYNRIKKKLEKHEEEMMELDFSDYHEDEDEALREAAVASSDWYKRALEDLNARRGRELSKFMNEKLGRLKYSKDRCHKRLEELNSGKGVVPFERDPDQGARRAATIEAIDARHAARKAIHDAAHAAAIAKRKKIDEVEKARAEGRAKLEKTKAEKEAAAEAARAVREAEKAERDAKRLENREKKAAMVAQKKKALRENQRAAAQVRANKELMQQQKQEERERQKQEKKKELARRAIEREEKRLRLLETKEKAAQLLREKMAQKLLEDREKKSGKSSSGTNPEVIMDDESDVDEAGPSDTPAPKVKVEPETVTQKPVTATTVVLSSSPRTTLKVSALRELCSKRGLTTTGKKEDLVARLMKEDESAGVTNLKTMCKARGLKVWGNKQVLMDRIGRDDVAQAK